MTHPSEKTKSKCLSTIALSLCVTLMLERQALADTYDVLYGAEFGDVVILNRDTQKYIQLDLNAVLVEPNVYARLVSNSEDGELRYSGAQNNPNIQGPLPFLEIKDIRGSLIYMESREGSVNFSNEQQEFFDYGRNVIFDVETQKIISDQLIASSEEEYNRAVLAGYNVVYNSGADLLQYQNYMQSFGSYSQNMLTNGLNGGLVSNGMVNSNGKSIIRSEADGTIHLGEKSLVFAERGVAGFNEDTLYSSNGVLQIGDNIAHRTVVRGTLEIQDPTAPSHAATKRYTDSSAALAMAMSSLPRSYNGKPMIGFGTGSLGGETAFAFGYSQSEIGSGFSVNANLGYSHNTNVGGAFGIGYEF